MSTVLLERPSSSSRTYSQECLNHCTACGAVSNGIEDSCRRCGADELESLPRIGEVFSYTTVHQGANSFVLALVELPGGQLVTSRIVGVQRELRIGLPVELAYHKSSDSGSGGLFFAPLPSEYSTN